MGKKYFKMYVRDVDGNIIGIGIGSSKQKGEKLAAKKALQYLKVIPNDNDNEIELTFSFSTFFTFLKSFSSSMLSLLKLLLFWVSTFNLIFEFSNIL